MSRWLNINRAAEYFDVDRSTLRSWIDQGLIPPDAVMVIPSGRRPTRRIDVEAVERARAGARPKGRPRTLDVQTSPEGSG